MRTALGAVGLVLLVLLAGCAYAPIGGQPAATPTEPSTPEPSSDGATDGSTPDGRVVPDFEALYDRTIDSVVMLRVRTDAGVAGGSGFVYDRRGHVVTNEHVVGSAETVSVRFRGGEWRTGTVVGTDVYSDLAVVRVADPPAYATPLPVADSNPEPGQHVVALGSPYGLEGSATAGIVSGVNRTMSTENGFSIPDTVQTDAAIHPGNSGGPLVSLDGEVVGVNRARTGANVGFAVSAAIVRRVVPSLVATGTYAHAYVGVVTVDVTPTIAEANGLERVRGLLVVDTPPGAPADGALQPSTGESTVDGASVPTGGDVIVAIDGRPVADHQALSRYLALRTSPGDRVEVTVIRNGSRRTVGLRLARRPPPDARASLPG